MNGGETYEFEQLRRYRFENRFRCEQTKLFNIAQSDTLHLITPSVLKVAVCACFSPKVHDGTPTLGCRICFLTCRYNKLHVDAEGPLKCTS